MHFAKRILPWVVALALVVPVRADDHASTYEISHVYSNVSFSITKIVFKEEGGFRDYSGETYFDTASPKRSHVQMIVRTAGIDTRVEGRDRVLRSDDFFDAPNAIPHSLS